MLTPNELASLSSVALPAGIAVVDGPPLSHPMLRLFGLGRPVVILSAGQAAGLPYDRKVTLDGGTGRLGEEVAEKPFGAGGEPAPRPGQPVAMTDGTLVALRASVGDAEGALQARKKGAEAIGLVRSEYLYPDDGRVPDLSYYRHALGAVAAAAAPLTVTVRLPDLSADKPVPWLGEVSGFAGPLGLHGSRLFRVEPVASAVRAEARAVGGLGESRAAGLLVPFLAEVGELVRWRDELRPLIPENMGVGAMLETPAAAREIAAFLAEADFVAIGCNDLMQTLFAADRDIPEVAPYLNPYSPVMLRFLAAMAEAASRDLDRVTVCGLLPQLPGLLPIFLGLGFRSFSVEPLLIPHLARVVTDTDPEAAARLAGKACAANRAGEVREELGLLAESPWAPEGGNNPGPAPG